MSERVKLDVIVFEERAGLVQRVAESTLTAPSDRPLLASVKQSLPQMFQSNGEEFNFRCFADDTGSERHSISLDQTPTEIQSIIEAVAQQRTPLLLLYRELQSRVFCVRTDEVDGGGNGGSGATTTATKMMKDFAGDIGPSPAIVKEQEIPKPRPRRRQTDSKVVRNDVSSKTQLVKVKSFESLLDNKKTQLVKVQSLDCMSSLSLNRSAAMRIPNAIRPRIKVLSTHIGEQFVKEVEVVFEDDVWLDCSLGVRNTQTSCNRDVSIADLKKTILLSRICNKKMIEPPEIVLGYRVDGREYELWDEKQILSSTYLHKLWNDKVRVPMVLKKKTPVLEKDMRLLNHISSISEVVMDDTVSDLSSYRKMILVSREDQEEVQWSRKTLGSFVSEITSSRNTNEYMLSVELDERPASTTLAKLIPSDQEVGITFHYDQSFSLTKRIHIHSRANSLLRDIFPCVEACGIMEKGAVMEQYVLQVMGEVSYISGETELILFKDIRRCIFRREEIHLSLTKKPPVEKELPWQFSWPLVDRNTGCAPFYYYSASKTRSQQAVTFSPDLREAFSLSILSLEVPFSPRTVQVSIGLYHGAQLLLQKEVEKELSLQRWKRVQFDLQTKKQSIPKAAKLRVTISARKNVCWGAVNVFDCRGMLREGEITLSLWPEQTSQSDNILLFKRNVYFPVSNNPDPKAAKLTLMFDMNRRHPNSVFFPASKIEDINVANKETDIQLLREIPKMLLEVNWTDFTQASEAYSYLHSFETSHFPVDIAFMLLDSDYPDENVRAFATRMLEKVPDGELEDFLLQLTQALKFERTHDSVLARFLLKRALNNKRIGHFFFWYLKCELHNPQYVPRFGVILEAYLKGCGQSMSSQFLNEIHIQASLVDIGKKLKKECNDDILAMRAKLPAALAREQLDRITIVPVYNPRLKLGNLQPQSSKIMASKKRPIWLDMSDITGLKSMPARIILKVGDDLRQDMITLKMFSLFEKLWETEGMNLALIPYGCMATGPNVGFIEVVKHAKTISEVSDVRNEKRLYEWIRNHQRNEFGEIDGRKVEAAIERFVQSCAGYSVATFVLGIGDRHNDNIMVTTSGNLFHIDFGHFLGSIKYFMGFKKEWTPFVLTPDFVYVMGGEGSQMFEHYKSLCCNAFHVLRRNADLIISLFSMMRFTGIPELTCVEDTDYIREALALRASSETEATEYFLGIIKKCLDLKWTVQMVWKIHELAKP